MQDKLKEDKQKVTLYLPQDLHRQLKIKAAVDSETMTDIAQRAIVFYLSNPELIDQYGEGYGHSHRVYSCPECSTSVVLREGEMVSLQNGSNVLVEDGLTVEKSQPLNVDSQGEGELVPC
ncbi:MAG: hypothetical protein NW220_23760 [Leptolyngbyaceae cyanobacterium bins.349]|nr:hypothetical protein [Leptolyngbyaceae cyanobacterium bins.349]